MQFKSTIFTVLSIAASVTAQEERSPEGLRYFSVVGPVTFSAKLKDGREWHLNVFDDLVMTPLPVARPYWSFKKTHPTAHFDTLWYQPENKVAVWHEPTQTFALRRVQQVAVGWWNLTPPTPSNLLKFDDSPAFRACKVAGPAGARLKVLKKLTKPEAKEPAWAVPGSCEDFQLKCTGCP